MTCVLCQKSNYTLNASVIWHDLHPLCYCYTAHLYQEQTSIREKKRGGGGGGGGGMERPVGGCLCCSSKDISPNTLQGHPHLILRVSIDINMKAMQFYDKTGNKTAYKEHQALAKMCLNSLSDNI